MQKKKRAGLAEPSSGGSASWSVRGQAIFSTVIFSTKRIARRGAPSAPIVTPLKSKFYQCS